MCYMTILSTTSGLDLTQLNSIDVIFSRVMPKIPEENLLKYPNKWYVGSSVGCSCGFRHLNPHNFDDLGFSEPVDWFSEEPEAIEATLNLVRAFKKIISDGSQLECIDAWCGDRAGEHVLSRRITVSLSQLSEAAFRLIGDTQHEILE
jgi:hypothetical protein